VPSALDAPAEQPDQSVSRVDVIAAPIGTATLARRRRAKATLPVIYRYVLGHCASDATIRWKTLDDETRGRIDQFPHSVADLDR
jgi:hypothetical protein